MTLDKPGSNTCYHGGQLIWWRSLEGQGHWEVNTSRVFVLY